MTLYLTHHLRQVLTSTVGFERSTMRGGLENWGDPHSKPLFVVGPCRLSVGLAANLALWPRSGTSLISLANLIEMSSRIIPAPHSSEDRLSVALTRAIWLAEKHCRHFKGCR